jgi:hypothetical protein
MGATNVRRRGMGSPEPRVRAVRGLTASRLVREPAAGRLSRRDPHAPDLTIERFLGHEPQPGAF